MRWSDRIKLALETFKRTALPLYIWYFIFAFVGVGLVLAGSIPFLAPIIRLKGTLSSPFLNPNVPMPPGRGFSSGSSPFGHSLSPYSDQAPYIFLILIILFFLAWIVSSAFITGMFNLTQKGFHEKVSFRDFRFSGIPRTLGWYGILTLVSLLLIVAGIIGALALKRMTYLLPFFAVLYVLSLIALGIFLAPWLSTSAFYMLNHRELSFTRSLSSSWDFYRQNMGSLWLLFITLIGIQVLLSLINQASQALGIFTALIVGPFTAILPIVWILSLEEEQNQHNTDSIPSSISPSAPDFPSSSEASSSQTPLTSPPETQDPPLEDEPETPPTDTNN